MGDPCDDFVLISSVDGMFYTLEQNNKNDTIDIYRLLLGKI